MGEAPDSDIGHPIAEVRAISKSFGATAALNDVSFSVTAGLSHALVGRNGAGKSTLVSVLTGLTKPDEGEVFFAGERAPSLIDREGWLEKVAAVYQKSTVIPHLTVGENLFLNAFPNARRGLISWRTMRVEGRKLLDDWGIDVDVDAQASDLDVGQRQLVEIARALRLGSRFIILDEPTAQLKASDIQQLFGHMRRLQDAGVTFLYISHHLEEIHEVCEMVTVLRDGYHVTTQSAEQLTTDDIVTAMVGQATEAVTQRTTAVSEAAPAVLEVRGLKLGNTCHGVDLTVRQGEFVGLAGLAGSGKADVADVIVGLTSPDEGEVRVAGAPLRPGSVKAAIRAGVGFVPQDRHASGFAPNLSVEENITLTIVDRLGPAGLVQTGTRRTHAERLMRYLEIVGGRTQSTSELSGGNQQKTVMGRALASNPKVLVLVNPTAGVDIASKVVLLSTIQEAGETGVLIVSDELEELAVCDRVLVIFAGRIIDEFARGWEEHELVAAIEGVRSDPAA